MTSVTLNASTTMAGTGSSSYFTGPSEFLGFFSQPENAAQLFLSVTIPQGVTITSAGYSATWSTPDGTPTSILANANFQAADTVTALPGSFSAYTSATRTTAHTAFHPAASSPLTFDVTGTLQEVINRPGWVSGGGLLLFLDFQSATGNSDINVLANAATISVVYTTGGGSTPPQPQIIVPNFAAQQAANW